MFKKRDVVTFRRILARLRPHAAGEGRWLALGTMLGLLVVVLRVAQPWPLKWIIDYLSGTITTGFVSTWIAAHQLAGIPALAMLFLGIAAAAAWAEYGQVMMVNGLGNRVLCRFRAVLFTNILAQPLAFHESREVGELLTRIVYDTSRLRRGLNSILIRVFKTLALFVTTTAVLLWLDVSLGLVLAAGGTIALRAMRRRGERIARAARRQRKSEGALATMVANELMSVRETQTFGGSQSETRKRFAGGNDRSLRREQKVRRLAASLSLRVEVLLAFSIAIALWLGAQSVLAGTLTSGDLVIFFSYAITLRTPFVQFATQTARIGRSRACGERLIKLDDRISSIQDTPNAKDFNLEQGAIEFDQVSLKAPLRQRSGRKWTLRDLSLSLPAGKRIGIVGSNGAGKSTLLRLALRLADPNGGRVLIDGQDLRGITVNSLRSQMSVVFQDSVLSGLTVRDNIALGVPDADNDRIEAAAVAAHASNFIEHLPSGYDTLVRKGGRLFSGGERQRMAIARALMRHGAIWLLDEPTAGLDFSTARDITDVLLEATQGRTTLWVTHDPELLPRLDWIVVFHKGKEQFSGTPEAYHARYGADSHSQLKLKQRIS